MVSYPYKKTQTCNLTSKVCEIGRSGYQDSAGYTETDHLQVRKGMSETLLIGDDEFLRLRF